MSLTLVPTLNPYDDDDVLAWEWESIKEIMDFLCVRKALVTQVGINDKGVITIKYYPGGEKPRPEKDG